MRPNLDDPNKVYGEHGEKPTEPIQVGQDLILIKFAAGGHHQFTRILPNNVSDYKQSIAR